MARVRAFARDSVPHGVVVNIAEEAMLSLPNGDDDIAG
jgi:hypothetical protein